MAKDLLSIAGCATEKMRFETPAKLVLEAAFDGGRLTSDGGLTWLAKADGELGLCETLARHVPEWRKREGLHSLLTLVRQRVYQIACGYEDQNDSDDLREDPLLKRVCGRLSESGQDLASQPTICRLENAATSRACYRMARAMVELYIAQRGEDGPPQKILLDFDATDDPTHGEQEESYYHGYFESHIYHPLLVFDGETGQLIAAVLRPGNTHASSGTVAELRADAGFAIPAVYDHCEAEDIDYTIALITNPRLREMAAPLLEEALRRYETSQQKAKLLSEGSYRAGSWESERRVVYKAEVMEEGTNTRFVVTNK